MQNEAAVSPKCSYQSRPRGPLQSFWAVCGLQQAPGRLVLDPAAYPAQTNGNWFSAAFSENQQSVRYYHSHTQKCFFKLHMAFILDSTTGYIDTLQPWPSQSGVAYPPLLHLRIWMKSFSSRSMAGHSLSARLLHCQYISAQFVLWALPDTTHCSSMPLLILSKTFKNMGAFTRIAFCPNKYNPPPACLLTWWGKEEAWGSMED